MTKQISPGQLVLIVQDCREEAVSQTEPIYGIYEGEMPIGIYCVTINSDLSASTEEIPYSDFNLLVVKEHGFVPVEEATEAAAASLKIDLPLNSDLELSEVFEFMDRIDEQRRRIGTPYYFFHRNPRIRLQDGSIIWGYQCWWKPVSSNTSN